jgi:hypothetical protein
MNCPDVGTWRLWLDEGGGAELEAHRVACADCRALVRELKECATHASVSLGALAPTALPSGAAVRLARARLGAEADAALPLAPAPAARAVRPVGVYAAAAPPRRGWLARWRLAAAGLAAAALVGVVATVPAAQTATASFLAQFRSQRFVPVQVDESQGQAVFAQLKELGVVQEPTNRRPERVGSLAEASQRVGFTVIPPDPTTLPTGVAATPVVEVSPATELRFTYQAAKAQEYLRRMNRSDFALQPRFEGATLVVNVPAAVLMDYRGADPDHHLLIGQAGEITAGVDGKVTLDELREYLLTFPGVPAEAARELRSLQDPERALPVPVPARASWQNTTINGNPALMLSDGTGLGSGVIWNHGGRIYGVAGNYRSAEILRVANGLR